MSLLLNSEAVCRSGMRSDQRATPPGDPCPGGTAAHLAPFPVRGSAGTAWAGRRAGARRRTEVQLFGDGEEVAQLAQVKIHPYSHGD
jgi:hypothetical protein